MARFAATQHALEKGLNQTSPQAGIKAIDDWVEQLNGIDKRGTKGLAGDLERLKRELEREQPREENVLKLVGKLGAATTKLADQAEAANQQKLRELGEGLTNAAGQHADAAEEND